MNFCTQRRVTNNLRFTSLISFLLSKSKKQTNNDKSQRFRVYIDKFAEPVAEQKEHFMFPPEVEEEPVSEATTEEEPKEKSPFDFWKKKEEQAKKAKETNPIQFKYGQTQAEAARKERAFKLKESSRFKFWKDREKEYKKAEKRKIQMQKGGRAALNIEDRDSEEDE